MNIFTPSTFQFSSYSFTRFATSLAFLFVLLFSGGMNAQSNANYTPATNATASLTDMSTGTTELSLASAAIPNTVYHDDDATPVTTFSSTTPFVFHFMGVPYTQFSVNSNGQMRLGGTTVGGTAITAAQAGPILAPLSGDNAIQTDGKVRYKITGSAPNRIAIIEWTSFRVPFSSTAGTGSNMQVRLYEATGAVEYVYGIMYANAATSRTVAWSSGTTATTSAWIATIGGTPTNTYSTAWTTTSFGGTASMTNLNGASNGSRRIFSWTPSVTPTVPTTLTFTSVASTSMTLNWVDASTNEYNFAVYNSSDGGTTWNYVGNTASTTTAATGGAYTFAATGLATATSYQWRVYAVGEGKYSTALSGTKGTPVTYTSVANADWNTASTWSPAAVPTAGDVVIINTNVTASSTPTNQVGSITVNNGFTLTLNGNYTNPSGSSITVNSGGTLALGAALTNTGTTTVSGTLQINQGGSVTGTAVAYGGTTTLTYAGTSTQTATAIEFPAASGPTNLTVNNSGGFRLPFSRTVAGNVTVTSGDVQNLSGTAVTLTMTGTSATLAVGGSITGTNVGSGNDINLTYAGTGTLTVNGAGSLCRFLNVTIPTATTLAIARGLEVMFGTFAINGNATLQINAGGYVSTTSPTYSSTSALIYNTASTSGSPYTVGTEWIGSSATAGVGIPNNVTIQGNTFITMPSGNRGAAGFLNVNSGSGITLNASTGDLSIGGNFTQNGTLTHNGRAINFFGTSATTQTISGSGLNTAGATNCFAYFLNNTTGTGGVTIGTNVTVYSTAGDVFQLLNAGPIKIGAFTLTLDGNGGNILTSGAARVIDFTSASGILLLKGSSATTLKTVTSVSSGSLSITSSTPGGQVQVQSGGFDCGSSLTTIGSGAFLTINTGGYVVNNSPTYATGSTLSFRTGAGYVVGSGDKTWGIGTSGVGVPDKVEVNTASTSVSITEDRTARSSVTVTSGTLTNNSKTLNIATTVTTGATALNINGGTVTNGGGTINIGVANGGNQALSLTSGALTISSGTVNLNGNVVNSGGTLTMSGGNFTIDPNSGTLATSVASGTIVFSITGGTQAVTGGTITFVDPPSAGAALTLGYSITTTNQSWVGNTIVVGGSSGTNATTATVGFAFDSYIGSGRLQLGAVTVAGGNTTDRYMSGPASTADEVLIGGTLTINSGSELRIGSSDEFNFAGNIVNNGTLTSLNTSTTAASSAINFEKQSGATSNTVAQTVSGTGTFRNSTTSSTAKFSSITFDNTASGAAVTFSIGDVTVSSATNFVNGIVDIGNNNSFTYVGTGVVVNRTNGYVLIQGTGQMKKDFATGASSFTFHVGENTGTTEYSPFTLSFSANSTARTIGVRPVDAIHPSMDDVDVQTDYISRYWQLSNSAAGTYTYTATATYLPADINGTEGNIKMNLWTGTSPWTLLTSSAASNVLTITSGVTNVSAPLGATADFTGRVKGSTTYTWNQTGSAVYSLDTNWTPARTTPAANDILVFDGAITPSPTVTGFASQTISKLLLTNSVNLNLQPTATATLTIAGGTGTDLDIPSGSTLNLSGGASVGLAFTGTTTSSIAGTLTFSSTAGTPTLDLTNNIATVTGTINLSSTTNATITTTSTTLLMNAGSFMNLTNGTTIIPLATWDTASTIVLSGSGSSFTNANQSYGNFTYNSSVNASTVSFFTTTTTGVIKGNANIQATGTGRFRFLTTGTLAINGNVNVSNAAVVDFINAAATLTVTGNVNVSNTAVLNFANGAGTISIGGSVTASDASIINFGSAAGANTTTIAGNVNLNSSATSVLSLASGSTQVVSVAGNFTQTAGTFSMGTGTGAGTLKVAGSFTAIALNNPGTGTANLIEFNGTTSQAVSPGASISGVINFKVSNPSGIAVTGTLPLNNGTTFTAASSGTAVTSGTVTYGTTTTLAYVTAVGAQTTGNEFPATSGPVNVTINNTNATPNVSLSGSRTVTGTLTITAGRILLGSNDLTSTGTQSITTPSTTKMIVTDGSGLYKRSIASGTGTYLFPIGENTGTIQYSQVTLQFTANSVARIVGAKVIDAVSTNMNTPSTPTNYLSRYWTFSENGAGGTYNYYINPAVAITGAEDENGTASLIKAAYWNGSTWTLSANTYTSGSLVSAVAGVSETAAPLGSVEWTGRDNPPVSYAWVGFTDGSWNTSTNWSPNGIPGSSDSVTLANGSTGAAANLSLTTAVTVNNLTFNGTGNFFTVGASPAAITVLGNVTYTAGTGTWNATSTFSLSSASSQTIPAFNYGNLNGTGGARVWTAGTTGIAGTFTTGAGAYTATSGSTVDYTGSGSQTIASTKYYDLTNSGNGARTLTTGTIDVANSYTPSTATTTPGTSNIFNFSSAGAQTIPASSYANITNTGNGNRTLASSGTITIAGTTFTPGSGTYTVTGSTVALTSTTGFNLTLPTVSSGNSFNVLTINGAGGTYTLPYSATTQNLATTLNIQAGTFVTNPASNTTALVNNIAVGTVNFSGGTIDDKSTGAVVTTTNLLISTAWNQTGGLATVTGAGLAKLIFTGGGATTFTGLTPSTNIIYYGLQVSNTTTLTLASNLAINGITGGTPILVDAGSTLNASSFVLSTTSTTNTFSINGTFKTSNLIGFTGSTTTAFNTTTNTPTVTLGTASTVEYTAASTQVVTNRTDYANLTLTGGSKTIGSTALTLSKTLTINAGATYNGAANPALTIGGDFLNSGTFTQGTGLLTFNGTTSQSVGGSTESTFNNVTVSGAAGGLSLGKSQTINGTLTLSASSGGNVDLNGSNNITLGATATVTGETCSRQFINTGSPTQGNGYIQTTRTFVSGTNYLGIAITTATSLGSTNIKRFVQKTVATPSGTNTIKRVYSVTPTTAATGNVTLTSSYCDGELNGNTESPVLITYYGTGTNETTGYSNVYATASNDATANTVTTGTIGSLIAGQNNITLANAGPDAYYTVQNGNWNTAATWALGAVPPTTADVTVKHTVAVVADATANSVKINASNSVTVTSGFDLNVANAIVNNGTLTIENNANLLQTNNVANTGTGSTIVKRNSAAIKRLDYTLWSSPVTGQELYAFSPFTFANRFYTYNPSNDLYTAYSGFAITGLNADNVNGTDGNHALFSTGTSYLIRAPWDHPTAPTVWTGIFTGVPNNGTVTLSSLTSGKFYAVGNPYPSTISADQFIADNSIGNNPLTPGDGLYFWRKTNNSSASSYATYTTAGGVKSGGDTLNIVPNGVIQVGQGFIVKTTSTSLAFNNGQRVGNNADQFLRSAAIERNRIWLNLSSSTDLINQMMVAYMTDATQGIDVAIDGRYFNDNATALNSYLNNEEFAIQGRSLPFDASDVVPLAFKAAADGNYTITLDHVDGLFAGGGQTIYLKDNLTNSLYDLSTGGYTFATTAGAFNSRFELVYQTALGTTHPTFTANNVIIYSQNHDFVINTGSVIMSSVKVFDIRGRLLLEKKGINSNQTVFNGGEANQVLMVQITSENGEVVNKKVIR
ncbi:T9SS sorting signal type C domain-containing protein [Flavobacterium sp. N1994]|uniref:T9SS sorting signal type C domain-containing protein n=1 Tax=Flavobacterium sp. N1994 TaxID=2986827 RepID=UPI002223995D|nr:T9SS sorting signal type C domain-containing protein [Flavobacterium sp. N1994]